VQLLRGRALAPLLALAILAGCEQLASYPPGEAEQSLVVHGMLLGGSGRQEIIVEYGRGIREGVYRGITPAAAADVVVTGKDAHRFTEDPGRPGVYRASFVPAPGERYTLRIQGPRGEVVTGTTDVPAAPRLVEPTADTLVSRTRAVTVRWTNAPAAAGYIVFAPDAQSPGFLGNPVHQGGAGDTSAAVELGTLGERQVRLWVAAVDANYLRYVKSRSLDAGPEFRLDSTVEGGWGVFGSTAYSDARLISFVR
jgi:hypothetical protein